jgi:hypothetical protein
VRGSFCHSGIGESEMSRTLVNAVSHYVVIFHTEMDILFGNYVLTKHKQAKTELVDSDTTHQMRPQTSQSGQWAVVQVVHETRDMRYE